MFRVILLQVIVTLLATLAAGILAGQNGAISAALGGLISAIPNLLFALRLKSVANRPGTSYPAAFFLGEFIKIALTIALLVLVIREYADLHWPSLLIGLGLALQAGFLAFWKKS